MIPRPSALAVLVVGKKACYILEDNPPTVPRIESRGCSLDETKGKNKTDLLTVSKWQIGLLLCLKPYRGGAACRRGSEASPLGEYPEGLSPLGDSLVTFSSGRKSPGCRAERLQVGAGTAVPQKPPGRGAERPGGCGGKAPKKLPGAHPPAVEREKRGAQRGQHLWCTPSHGGEKPRAAHPLRKSRSFIKIYNLFISLLHLCYIIKRTK